MNRNNSRTDYRCAPRGILGPDWRRQLAAQRSASSGLNCHAWLDDPLLRELSSYLALQAAGGEQFARTQQKFPNIIAAERLNADPNVVAKLKLMVIGDLPLDEIRAQLKIDSAVIETWEKIFFDVRELRGATSWLAVHVVNKEQAAGDFALASRLKLAACGGPVAVRAILNCDSALLLDKAGQLFQRRLKLDLKFEEALAMPMTDSRQVMQFVKLYIEMQTSLNRLTLEEKKLAQKSSDARDRHQLAQLRHELQVERAARDEAKWKLKIQRADERKAEQRCHQEEADVLAQYRKNAELRELECRFKDSPLAQLRWASGSKRAASESPLAPSRDRPIDRGVVNIDDEGHLDRPPINILAELDTGTEQAVELMALTA